MSTTLFHLHFYSTKPQATQTFFQFVHRNAKISIWFVKVLCEIPTFTRTFRAAARMYWSSSSRTKNKAPYLRKGSAPTKLFGFYSFIMCYTFFAWSTFNRNIPVKLPWLHGTPRGVWVVLPLERRNSYLQNGSQPVTLRPMALRMALPGSRPVRKQVAMLHCADDILHLYSSMFLLRDDLKI